MRVHRRHHEREAELAGCEGRGHRLVDGIGEAVRLARGRDSIALLGKHHLVPGCHARDSSRGWQSEWSQSGIQ